jgi:hypothetical protein
VSAEPALPFVDPASLPTLLSASLLAPKALAQNAVRTQSASNRSAFFWSNSFLMIMSALATLGSAWPTAFAGGRRKTDKKSNVLFSRVGL